MSDLQITQEEAEKFLREEKSRIDNTEIFSTYSYADRLMETV